MDLLIRSMLNINSNNNNNNNNNHHHNHNEGWELSHGNYYFLSHLKHDHKIRICAS